MTKPAASGSWFCEQRLPDPCHAPPLPQVASLCSRCQTSVHTRHRVSLGEVFHQRAPCPTSIHVLPEQTADGGMFSCCPGPSVDLKVTRSIHSASSERRMLSPIGNQFDFFFTSLPSAIIFLIIICFPRFIYKPVNSPTCH